MKRHPLQTPLGTETKVVRALLASIDEIAYVVRLSARDPTRGTVQLVSCRVNQILGRRPGDFLRDPGLWMRMIHPEDVPAVARSTRGILTSGKSGTRIYRVRHGRTGRYRWIDDRVVPMLDRSGRVVGIVGAARDITLQRQGEEARGKLLKSEQAARAKAEATLARLRAVQSVTDAALAHMALPRLTRVVLGRVRRLLKVDFAVILLLGEGKTDLYVHDSQGCRQRPAKGARVRVGQGIAGRALARRQPVASDDVPTASGAKSHLCGRAGSLLAVPLVVEGKAVGVLEVGTRRRRRFGEEARGLLQLVADRVAPAIDRLRLFAELRESSERLGEMSRRLVEAQEAERQAVGRELHDEVAQVLTGYKLKVERKKSNDWQGEWVALTADLMGKVRELSLRLRPSMLDDLGLVPALLWHFERYTEQTGVRVRFQHSGLNRRFAPTVETAAFRIIQEALTNVARHARVDEASVEVGCQARALRVCIEDRGLGMKLAKRPPAGAGGLTGMHERLRLLGGQLKLDSSPGAGMRLLVQLPLDGSGRRAKGGR